MKLFNTEYQGEGWYTFDLWNNDMNDWEWAKTPPAVWIENENEFEQNASVVSCKLENACLEFDTCYYGDGEIPNAPVEIENWCYETLTPKSQAAYKEMMGW